MNIETVPIESITPDPANLRLHDARNLDGIKASLARFGQQKPIVVNAAGVVLAGNGTLASAKALGWTNIKVVRTQLVGADAVAYAIADNRAAELASWDDPALARTLESLRLQDERLPTIAGFDPAEIEKLTAGHSLPGFDETDEDKPICLRGIRQVVVECQDEAQQQELYERLIKEGYSCRVSTL